MICNNQNYIFVIFYVIMMAIEYWLGKTDRVKSGSTLELIFNIIKLVLRVRTK